MDTNEILYKQKFNNIAQIEWEDTFLFHTNKTRNNRPVLVLKRYGNFYIHKRTGRNPPAFLLLFDARNLGRL